MAQIEKAIFEIADSWCKQGTRFAIAMVTASWGSSPRKAGAGMLVSAEGDIAGSVSGGCIEAEVIDKALSCIANKQMETCHFGVSDELAWSNGLSCGGEMSLQILPVMDGFVSAETIADITGCFEARAPAYLVIDRDGCGRLVRQKPDDDKLIFAVMPTKQIIIIGASHIAQYLCEMAQMAEFDVAVIDPRASFITRDRFPHGRLYEGWPSTHLQSDMIDGQTAIVTLTHNPRIDDEALTLALASDAFHIAALGSRRTHEARLARLQAEGALDVRRIKGPAGLALGAQTPAEIAVSILAEIIRAYRNHEARL